MTTGYVALRPGIRGYEPPPAGTESPCWLRSEQLSTPALIGEGTDLSCATQVRFAKVGQKEGRGLLLQNGFAMDPVCGCLPRANSQANVMTSACNVCVSDPNALGICLCFRREPRSRVDANFDHIRNVVVAAGF